MNNTRFASIVAFCLFGMSGFTSAIAQQPRYQIINLGLVGESVSGGQAVSDNGQFAAGFSNDDPFLWNTALGTTGLSSLASRPFSTPWGVNDTGSIAGIGATTFFGSDALPVVWQKGIATPLGLPAGQTLGRAYAINNSELVVGSVDGGSLERAASFSPNGPGTILTQTLAGGVLRTAYGVNDAGRTVGQALDPDNAAVIKGFYLDPGDTEASDVGALTALGHNSAIAFDVSSNGLITGSSSINGGADGRPFLWSEAVGMIEIPLPLDTSTASGRGVNADGWVVGTAGGLFAIPFLNDGTATYRLHDLIDDALWDLSTGTSNGAFAIADNGTIVGRGLYDGQLTAFAMVLATTLPPTTLTVVRGIQTGGTVDDLLESDDVDVRVLRDPGQITSLVEVEVKSVTPVANPSSFEFSLEASAFFRGNVTQTIEFWDYDASEYVEVDSRDASQFVDSVAIATGSGDLSRFVEVGTGCVRTCISYRSDRARQRYSAGIDQVFWSIE